jgi:hypothetical protein
LDLGETRGLSRGKELDLLLSIPPERKKARVGIATNRSRNNPERLKNPGQQRQPQ